MFLEKAYRGRDNRWYMYLFTVLVVFVAMQVGAIPFAVYNFKSLASGERAVATGSLVDLALMLFSFVVALLALLACVKYLHGKRVIDLFSGRVRFDFRRFFFAAIVWGGLTFLTFGITCLVDSSSLRFQFDLFPFLATCLVLLVFLPFQVAWEECMFRGYLMQGFAALFRYRWVPFVLTSLIFGLMHGANPEVVKFGFWMTMPQYILMGLILGYVAVKDDGIELALGLHFINNFLTAILVTHEASAMPTNALFVDTDPGISPWDALIIAACGLLFIWLCNIKYHFIANNKLREKIKSERNIVPLASKID